MRVVRKEDPSSDCADWLARPAAERIAAVELLRRTSYSIAGLPPLPRLVKEISFRPSFGRPS